MDKIFKTIICIALCISCKSWGDKHVKLDKSPVKGWTILTDNATDIDKAINNEPYPIDQWDWENDRKIAL